MGIDVISSLPRFGGRVRWGHPLTDNLVFCAVWPMYDPTFYGASGETNREGPPDLVTGSVPVLNSTYKYRPAYTFNRTHSVAPYVTLETWARFSSISHYAYQALINNESSSPVTNSGYTQLLKSSGHIATYGLYGAVVQNVDGAYGTALTTDRWYHIVSVFTNRGIFQYINGKLDYSNTDTDNWVSARMAQGRVVVGNANVDVNRVIRGQIALAKVYGRSLTAQEVAWLYEEPSVVLEPSNIARKYYSIPVVAASGLAWKIAGNHPALAGMGGLAG